LNVSRNEEIVESIEPYINVNNLIIAIRSSINVGYILVWATCSEM